MTPPNRPSGNMPNPAALQGGLVEVLAGVAILGVAFAWALDQVVFGPVAALAVQPFYGPAHRRWVAPGLAALRSDDREPERLDSAWWKALALGLLVLAAVGATAWLGSPDSVQVPASDGTAWAAGLPAALLGLMACAAGSAGGGRRFFGHAAAALAVSFGTAVSGAEPALGIAICGLYLLVFGGMDCMRFRRTVRTAMSARA